MPASKPTPLPQLQINLKKRPIYSSAFSTMLILEFTWLITVFVPFTAEKIPPTHKKIATKNIAITIQSFISSSPFLLSFYQISLPNLYKEGVPALKASTPSLHRGPSHPSIHPGTGLRESNPLFSGTNRDRPLSPLNIPDLGLPKACFEDFAYPGMAGKAEKPSPRKPFCPNLGFKYKLIRFLRKEPNLLLDTDPTGSLSE